MTPSTPIAEDFCAIAQRMQELARKNAPGCLRCEDSGWVAYGLGRGELHFRECPCCLNPTNRAAP
jgi:hypothetical protein